MKLKNKRTCCVLNHLRVNCQLDGHPAPNTVTCISNEQGRSPLNHSLPMGTGRGPGGPCNPLSPFTFQTDRSSDVLRDKGPDSELCCIWLSHLFGLLSSGIAFQFPFDFRGLLKREGRLFCSLSRGFRWPDAPSLRDSGWVPLAGIPRGDAVLLPEAYRVARRFDVLHY